MTVPGPCALCGKNQIVRYRLGDERFVGNCCLIAALRHADAVLIRAAFLARLGVRLEEDDE